jgi:hypothetical protein
VTRCRLWHRYYTKEGGELKGTIPLEGNDVRLSSAPNSHDYELEVLTPDRTFRVRAANDDERLAWLDALREVTGGAGGGALATAIWQEDIGDIRTRQEIVRDPEGELRIHALGRRHAAAGTVYTDPDFPPDDTSLFGAGGRAAHTETSGAEWRRDQKPFLQDQTVVWKAPQEILDPSARAVVFSGGIEADDIRQGALGNCYFLAAMAACAAHQSLIEDLVVEGVPFFIRHQHVARPVATQQEVCWACR